MLGEAFIAIVGWTLLLPTFYALGATVRPYLSEQHKIQKGIYLIAFGILFFIVYLILIGSFHLLNRGAIVIFVVGVLILRRHELRNFLDWFVGIKSYLYQASGWTARFAQIALTIALLLTAFFCFLPELANDALCYQLNLPKRFVAQGSIWPIQYDVNSYIPVALNYLYSVGLLFGSVAMAKFFHWWLGVFLMLSVAATIDRLKMGYTVSIVCAALFWLTPTVLNEVTTTYVDVGASFFVFLSLVLLISEFQRKQRVSFFLSGLLMGGAIGIKMTLLATALPLGVVFLWLVIDHRQQKRALNFALYYLLGCGLMCSYWLIRNYLLVGNPTFPYFSEIFGSAGLSNYAGYLSFGTARSLFNYILIPIQTAVSPQLFGQSYWMGPFYLILFPFALLSAWQREGRPYFIFLFLFVSLWFFMYQQYRHLLPVLPVWIVAGAYGLSQFRHWGEAHPSGKKLLQLGTSALIMALLAVGVFHYRYQFRPLFGIWSRDTYLRKMERTYPIARWMDQYLPRDAKIFNVEDVRQYYFTRETLRETNLRIFVPYWENKTAAEIIDYLKAEGFTHLLSVKMIGSDKVTEPRLAWVAKALANKQLTRLMITLNSENIREVKAQYALYEIKA